MGMISPGGEPFERKGDLVTVYIIWIGSALLASFAYHSTVEQALLGGADQPTCGVCLLELVAHKVASE